MGYLVNTALVLIRIVYNNYILGDVLHSAMVDHVLMERILLVILVEAVGPIMHILWWWAITSDHSIVIGVTWRSIVTVHWHH